MPLDFNHRRSRKHSNLARSRQRQNGLRRGYPWSQIRPIQTRQQFSMMTLWESVRDACGAQRRASLCQRRACVYTPNARHTAEGLRPRDDPAGGRQVVARAEKERTKKINKNRMARAKEGRRRRRRWIAFTLRPPVVGRASRHRGKRITRAPTLRLAIQQMNQFHSKCSIDTKTYQGYRVTWRASLYVNDVFASIFTSIWTVA